MFSVFAIISLASTNSWIMDGCHFQVRIRSAVLQHLSTSFKLRQRGYEVQLSAAVKDTEGAHKSVDSFIFFALQAWILFLKANKIKDNVSPFHLELPLFTVAWFELQGILYTAVNSYGKHFPGV